MATDAVHFDSDLPHYGTRGGVRRDPAERGRIVSPPLMWAEALDLLLARLRPRADLRRGAAVSGSAPVWMDSSTAPPPELCSPPAAPRPSPSGSNAFEERGDAILHPLSPPKAIFLPRCLFCWRRLGLFCWRRHQACTVASARHKCFCLALLDSVLRVNSRKNKLFGKEDPWLITFS